MTDMVSRTVTASLGLTCLLLGTAWTLPGCTIGELGNLRGDPGGDRPAAGGAGGDGPAGTVAVSVSPTLVSAPTGGSQRFAATVTGSSDIAVTWSVEEAGGGSIDVAGTYTAPSTEGTFHVRATSVAESTAFGRGTAAVLACSDTCPATNGLPWRCHKRFVLGTNWAWRSWAGDFGGVAPWGFAGVAAASATFSASMAEMKAARVDVIRWWMFPRFLSDGIAWAADDVPSGITGTLVADIQEALALAEQHDVYLMLTPFSFDNFQPTADESGIYSRGLAPLITDPGKRQRLLQNLVRPIAAAVAASPFADRMIAWDMINEPEWAITGANAYGGEDFSPDTNLQAVTHAQMETFLNEMAAVLRAEGSALVSVSGAAIKWGSAWTHTDVDFYMLHYYGWIYQWYPYDSVTLASVGLTDKPVVMGEFPNDGLSAIPAAGLPARSVEQFVADLRGQGYAGALSWMYADASFSAAAAGISAFATSHPCETAY